MRVGRRREERREGRGGGGGKVGRRMGRRVGRRKDDGGEKEGGTTVQLSLSGMDLSKQFKSLNIRLAL